ncbi:MAG: M20/M25/M40 family metallo-hydrolase [Anaerolineales bacterium]|nr:M20/M25/M40 family metallo-hydrolase [Anaerolineales bacterium]
MSLHREPERLLQKLIQFDTTNPPGNERACIEFIRDLLLEVGIESEVYAKTPERPNLVARIKGRGEAPPLMLYGHVDVVTTGGQIWKLPPFEGQLEDGFIWGRGALDMKSGVAMQVAAFMRLKEDGVVPAGDVVLMSLSDEEVSAGYGAKYMVENHPEVFEGVRYALGEFGGFNLTLGGKRFYPIQVAEKQLCTLELIIRGPGGHGSSIVENSASSKLAVVLDRLNNRRTPVHIPDPTRTMIEGIAAESGLFLRMGMEALLIPILTDWLLKKLGRIGMTFMLMFHNTTSPTIIRGGDKSNVVPSEIKVTVDGRMLPGMKPELFVAEVRNLIGFGEEDVEINVVRYEPGPDKSDLGLFEQLSEALKTSDPDGVPVPYLLTAVTDARHLAELGIQSYGFTPMKLPEGFAFFDLAHNADERIPVEAVGFGTETIYEVLKNYRG